MLKLWWHNVKVRWYVQKYLDYKREHEEWRIRYVTDSPKTERTQYLNLLKCKEAMEKSVDRLIHKLKFTTDTWVEIGTGQEVKLNTGEAEETLEVRWN